MRINELITQYDAAIFKSRGYDIVDQLEIGDYTLSLIGIIPANLGYVSKDTLYQVGFGRTGNHISTRQQQLRKIPLDAPPSFDSLREILTQIKKWISKYGPISAGSDVKQKTDTYFKILSRFGPQAGLKVERARYFGHNVVLIS